MSDPLNEYIVRPTYEPEIVFAILPEKMDFSYEYEMTSPKKVETLYLVYRCVSRINGVNYLYRFSGWRRA